MIATERDIQAAKMAVAFLRYQHEDDIDKLLGCVAEAWAKQSAVIRILQDQMAGVNNEGN